MRMELRRTYDDDRHAPAPWAATALPFRVLCASSGDDFGFDR